MPTFEDHRSLLVAVAYRILGSVADAEDVVQEAWLRWSGVDESAVEDPKAYLITVTTRLAIDRLRSAKSRRESYVGPWLPEPISTAPDVAEHAELADSVEMAMLVVLETLSPLERAVFVLREAFDLPFAEIAETIGRTEAATRQLARRAREHVRDKRPRFDVDQGERRRITERFLGASTGGDLDALIELFSDQVTIVSDGGGKARAALRVITGAENVGRYLQSIRTPANIAKFMVSIGMAEVEGMSFALATLNNAPAIVISAGGRVVSVLSLLISDGKIETIYLMANPDKIGHLQPA
ncbi:ECF-sigma factor [[Actinomadura] parvosata subsp. kistnae]|uniref:RNA polymerase subunit sigma-24 n=1 Tax=[Actinomadura] parvosata subsp. kistnae TaxID=1909395 RepID=A0A1V0AHW2_9ACTN|nr:RNA polymerase sigma-70 factor [Nonomuraea sp. ATCC 55076]AQZ69800.1 RNA polymerase subunit sigma-24 [Nonomuraea sp. ATCC 55076]SPL90087.1 ECF-sigma factor [Actinomadura parvosata subsp. kistnae]